MRAKLAPAFGATLRCSPRLRRPLDAERLSGTCCRRALQAQCRRATALVNNLLEKKPFRLVSVALANKLARIAWAILTRGETYRPYGLAA